MNLAAGPFGEPNGMMSYVFCGNDPWTFTDPEGLDPWVRVKGFFRATWGVVQGVAGISLATGGTLTEAGSAGVSTPVSVPAMLGGAVIAAHGADDLSCGLRELWYGEPVQGTVSRLVEEATGSHELGELADVSLGLPGGVSVAAKALPAIERGAVSLDIWVKTTRNGQRAVAIGNGLLTAGLVYEYVEHPEQRGEIATLAFEGYYANILAKSVNNMRNAVTQVSYVSDMGMDGIAREAEIALAKGRSLSRLEAYERSIAKYIPVEPPLTPIQYPPNDGFDMSRGIVSIQLQPGMRFDRFGPLTGSYGAPVGTPFSARSLPFDPREAQSQYYVFEVLKSFNVDTGFAVPCFGQPGGGIQFKLNKPLLYYQEEKYIKVVE